MCAKKKVKSQEVENKFFRNDAVSKQNLIDSLLEHNSNLLNHQCCRVIQDTQSNVRSGTNTDVTETTLIIMELILSLMKRPINKPPLIKITIKRQYIKAAMMVT